MWESVLLCSTGGVGSVVSVPPPPQKSGHAIFHSHFILSAKPGTQILRSVSEER